MINFHIGARTTLNPTVLFENVLLASTATVTGGGDSDLAFSGGTYDFWEATSATSYIDFALSVAAPMDCLCIAAHTLGSVGATVSLSIGGVEITSYSPDDDSAIMMLFPYTVGDDVRLTVTDGPAQIGVIMCGKSLSFQRGISGGYVPTDWGVRREILGGTTIEGQFLPQRVIKRTGETRVSLVSIDASWWSAEGEAFQYHYDEGQPFFFAGGPSLFSNDIAYCQRGPSNSEMRPTRELGGFVSAAFDVTFYA